jgi:hypothetical protein
LGSIVLARAAFDAAVKEWPHERFTLRQGIMTMREYPEARASDALEQRAKREQKRKASDAKYLIYW